MNDNTHIPLERGEQLRVVASPVSADLIPYGGLFHAIDRIL